MPVYQAIPSIKRVTTSSRVPSNKRDVPVKLPMMLAISLDVGQILKMRWYMSTIPSPGNLHRDLRLPWRMNATCGIILPPPLDLLVVIMSMMSCFKLTRNIKPCKWDHHRQIIIILYTIMNFSVIHYQLVVASVVVCQAIPSHKLLVVTSR